MTQVEGYQVTEDRVGWNIVFAAGRTFVGSRFQDLRLRTARSARASGPERTRSGRKRLFCSLPSTHSKAVRFRTSSQALTDARRWSWSATESASTPY